MDVGSEEMANAVRGAGVFPPEWGVPAGRQFSEERARWVRDRVREHMGLKNVQHRAAAQAAIRVEHLRRRMHLHMLRCEPF
ncbi:hypothetical protein GCM10010381_20610 [Streptomyces xantholiticus]|nr:hypothetical protein GCM10010381_20610 [Streptomyces xantholiticus]